MYIGTYGHHSNLSNISASNLGSYACIAISCSCNSDTDIIDKTMTTEIIEKRKQKKSSKDSELNNYGEKLGERIGASELLMEFVAKKPYPYTNAEVNT